MFNNLLSNPHSPLTKLSTHFDYLKMSWSGLLSFEFWKKRPDVHSAFITMSLFTLGKYRSSNCMFYIICVFLQMEPMLCCVNTKWSYENNRFFVLFLFLFVLFCFVFGLFCFCFVCFLFCFGLAFSGYGSKFWVCHNRSILGWHHVH